MNIIRLLIALAVLGSAGVLSAADPSVTPEAAGQPLLPVGLEEKVAAVSPTNASIVTVTGQAFSKAAHLNIPAKTKNPWDLQFLARTLEPVTAGDLLAVMISARAASGSGLFVMKLQDAKNEPLLRENVQFGGDWKTFIHPVKATRAYERGGLGLALFLGMQRQEIEIAGIQVINLGSSVNPAELTPQSLGIAAANAVVVLPAPAQKLQLKELPKLPPVETPYRRFVMFKFDDFKWTGSGAAIHWKFQRLADYCIAHRIRAGFGVIANTFETCPPAFSAWIKTNAMENGGPFEFWLHGYDHGMGFQLDGVKCEAEFSGPPYEYQAAHLAKACKLYTEKTGLVFHSFGSAGNRCDASGVRALEEQPDIKIWLYGDAKAHTGKFVLGRTLNLEYAVGRVGLEQFLKGYQWQRKKEYFVLQGHPLMWSDQSWADFTRIAELLAADKFEFVTPYEYYQHQLKQKPPSIR